MAKKLPYDGTRQQAVIKSSICTGEKVAGFKNLDDGQFVEVMLIRTPKDEQQFKKLYGLKSVSVEY